MAYEKLNLKTGDRFEAEHVGYIETALAEVISSDEGKADQEALDTRVPAELGLRLDTTVGTRIFAGDTMILGDTGRRSVPEISPSLDASTSGTHGIYIRRVGDLVTLTASGKWISGQWITESIPLGFRPFSGEYLSVRGIAQVDGATRTFGNSGTLIRLNFLAPFPSEGVSVSLSASWYTADNWPSSLPGTPA